MATQITATHDAESAHVGADRFWPILLGPLGMSYCLAAGTLSLPAIHAKSVQEVVAIAVTACATAAGLTRALRTREAIAILLTAVAATTLLREIHWEWTTRAVYVILAGIALWGFAWRKRVLPYLEAHQREGAWLICTAATYFLSQFIARKGFQHMLPESSTLHQMFQMTYDDMEEVVENVAHAMLLVTILHGVRRWAPGRGRDSDARRSGSH